MSNNKTCTRCGEEKPATLEYFHKRSENGIRSDCKVCANQAGAAYYEANKEKKKAYREANREAILKQRKAYREANREAILEQRYAHYRTPKGKFIKIKMKAKERGINFSLPLELYETQLWGKPCHYCGCKIEITGLDRKDSSKGYSRDNVVPCCRRCNSQKQNKPYEQFIQEQKEKDEQV